MPELVDQTQHLLQGYRHFHLHENEITDDERADKEALAKQAADTFHAMFRGRIGDEEFLLGSSERDVMQTLTSWIEDARPRSDGRTEGLTLPACSETLANLSSETPSNRGPAVWPFIRKIKCASQTFESLL